MHKKKTINLQAIDKCRLRFKIKIASHAGYDDKPLGQAGYDW